jgi:uncharacterized membrane protein
MTKDEASFLRAAHEPMPMRGLRRRERVLIAGSVVLSVTYVLPLMFLLGAAACLSVWDSVMTAKSTERGWFIAWVVGLCLAVLGAVFTFFILPRTPTI